MRCGSATVPDGAARGGKVADPAAVAQALKPLLARTEITQTRALVAASDSVATFRILNLSPALKASEVDGAIARELPFDAQRMATRWHDVVSQPGERTVYAAAWDRAMVRNISDAVRFAGLDPVVIELKSASLARVAPFPSCILIDLSTNPAEMVVVDNHLPRVWHSIPIQGPLSEVPASVLAPPLRSVLRFYRRHSEGAFETSAPVLVSGEHTLPPDFLSSLSHLVGHPAAALQPPARVALNVRHSTYLACLGLLMRRS